MSKKNQSGRGTSKAGAGGRRSPPSRRTFRTASDELVYCCSKASHFLLWVGRRQSAGRYVARMKVLVRRLPNHEAIVIATAKALMAEFEQDLKSGGIWRRREAERIARLYRGLEDRAQVESVTARFAPLFRIRAVRDAYRRVLRLYDVEAPPKDAALVRESIRSIPWLGL